LANAERRKTLRVELALPVRVQGYEADGSTWSANSSTADISAGGLSLPLERSVALGQVLLLVLPLPKRLRQYDLNDASYRVYALVRGIRRVGAQQRVGVMFFGKFPPRGFVDQPWARFLLPSDAPAAGGAPGPVAQPGSRPAGAAPAPPAAGRAPAPSPPPPPAAAPPPQDPSPPVRGAPGGKERRRYPRFSLFMNFTIQQVDEWGAVLQEELTVADSLGKGGADVMTTLHLAKGDVVLLQETGGGFATRAEVREITRGDDGVGRLHLRFVDRLVPDRMLQKG
jgi:PilZ domain